MAGALRRGGFRVAQVRGKVVVEGGRSRAERLRTGTEVCVCLGMTSGVPRGCEGVTVEILPPRPDGEGPARDVGERVRCTGRQGRWRVEDEERRAPVRIEDVDAAAVGGV